MYPNQLLYFIVFYFILQKNIAILDIQFDGQKFLIKMSFLLIFMIAIKFIEFWTHYTAMFYAGIVTKLLIFYYIYSLYTFSVIIYTYKLGAVHILSVCYLLYIYWISPAKHFSYITRQLGENWIFRFCYTSPSVESLWKLFEFNRTTFVWIDIFSISKQWIARATNIAHVFTILIN